MMAINSLRSVLSSTIDPLAVTSWAFQSLAARSTGSRVTAFVLLADPVAQPSWSGLVERWRYQTPDVGLILRKLCPAMPPGA